MRSLELTWLGKDAQPELEARFVGRSGEERSRETPRHQRRLFRPPAHLVSLYRSKLTVSI